MGGMLPAAAMSALQIGMDAAQRNTAAAAAKSDAGAQVAEIRQSQDIQARDRQDQLRRALATQRARFGAQGLESGSGSADAALAGLQADAQQQNADAQAMTDLRIQKIGDQLDWQQRRNLLAASQAGYRTAFSTVQRGLRTLPLLDSGD